MLSSTLEDTLRLFGKERFVCLLRKHRVREKEQENC